MPVRSTDVPDPRFVDRWDGGVGWLASPDGTLRRASHALRTDGASGWSTRSTPRGSTTGSPTSATWRASSSAPVGTRVPVTVPAGLGRVRDRVDAPVERVAGRLPGTDYRLAGSTLQR